MRAAHHYQLVLSADDAHGLNLVNTHLAERSKQLDANHELLLYPGVIVLAMLYFLSTHLDKGLEG